MTGTGWLSASAADVPEDDAWLGPRERDVLAGLRVPKRRADWRLGRWTVKRAIGFDAEVLAAEDGAPEAWLGDERAPVAISLSHRKGRALAVVAEPGVAVGCDIEAVEPRSDAFIRGFLAEGERERAFALDGPERSLAANLAWTAKEAAAKALREGLRLDVRNAVSVLGTGSIGAPPADGAWRPLRVDWPDRPATHGWWRAEAGWVMTVACEPAAGAPHPLEGRTPP